MLLCACLLARPNKHGVSYGTVEPTYILVIFHCIHSLRLTVFAMALDSFLSLEKQTHSIDYSPVIV